jgi:hypothetical protein
MFNHGACNSDRRVGVYCLPLRKGVKPC